MRRKLETQTATESNGIETMSHSYYWEITLDRTAEPGTKPGTNMNAVGVCNGNPKLADRKGIQRSRFEMLDDDGNSYYKGFIYHRGGEELFAPLDDFGEPNAGAVTIKIDGEIL